MAYSHRILFLTVKAAFPPATGLFLALALFSSASAQNFNFEQRVRLKGGSQDAEQNKSIDELPEGLTHDNGKISLVADFDKTKTNRVPVYFINATGQACEIETVAYELPLFLEAEIGEDIWERAEVQNSYGVFSKARKTERIAPGTFRVKMIRNWVEGEPTRLRFALYQNGKAVVASKPFEGLLPIGQIHEARYDLMAHDLIPAPLRIRYQPEITTTDEVSRDWLARIELLRSLGPCYNELEEAQLWAGFIHQNPVSTREERDLAVSIQKELLREWPLQYDVAGLLEKCLLVVEGNPSENRSLRHLCWRVLGEFADTKWVSPRSRTLATQAYSTVANPSASAEEKEACVDFLCLPAVADLHSPVRELNHHDQKLYGEKNPYVRLVLANWLMRKRQISQLGKGVLVKEYYSANWDAITVYELVKYLHFDRLHNTHASANWELWTKALSRDLGLTFPQFAMMFEGNDSLLFETKLNRKDLPENIEEQLESFYNQSPNTSLGRVIRRFLDTKEKRALTPFVPVF